MGSKVRANKARRGSARDPFSAVDKRIFGRNQRNQVTSIQKTDAIRDAQGIRDSKAGLAKFLFRHKKPE